MSTGKATESSQMLREAFNRKKKIKPAFSQAALARDLGVSSAFVTNLFTGKKFPPKDSVAKLVNLLELDSIERRTYVQLISFEKESSSSFKKLLRTALVSELSSNRNRKYIAATHGFLSRWYNFAVLEALQTPLASGGLSKIAKALGLLKHESEEALETLIQADLVEKSTNSVGWRKKEKDLYIPAARSRFEMRNFHVQMIEKAKTELTNKTSDEDYQKRLITGFTFSCRPEDLESMKVKIQEFLSSYTSEFSEGDCSEVYQINVQLFPLTRSSGENQ